MFFELNEDSQETPVECSMSDFEPLADVHVEVDAAPPPVRPVATPQRVEGHAVFGQDFGSSAYDYTQLYAEGRALRAEAERFVCWCRHMGESSTAAATWGTTQQDYAAAWRLRHRAIAAKLKSDAPPRAEFLNYIFAEPTAVTQQAREELGL
jgi:hypothetical protein